MKDYSMEVETVGDDIRAVIIGGGYIAKKLSRILYNRGLGCTLISRAIHLDLSSIPEFIFIFNNNNGDIPEAVLNFVETIKSKLIMVSVDKPCGDNLIKQCLDKDINFCSVSVYDVFGGSGTGSALENVFPGAGKKKLISFKNDQVLVTPIFVDDAAEGLCRIAFFTQTFKKKFLITGKEEIPLVGFINRVSAEAGRIFGFILKPEEQSEPYPEAVVRHEKIIKRDESYLLLNWQPEVNLAEGIRLSLNSQPEAVEKEQPEVKKKMILSP